MLRTLALGGIALLAVTAMALIIGIFDSPDAEAQTSPPATPSWVSITRGDGTITANWPEADGADSYHITYSSTLGYSWQLAAYGHTETSITITGADNNAFYVVGVRGLNDNGGGGWRNSKISPPNIKPIAAPPTPTPPTATPTPTPTPTATPASPPPSAPASITVSRGDGTVTATWPAASNAAGYHVAYTANYGQSWHFVAYNIPGTSAEVTGATNSATYIVRVNAINAAGSSGWRYSAPAGPWTPPPTATPTPEPTPTPTPMPTATPTPTPAPRAELTVSDVSTTAATLNLANYAGSWHYQSTSPPADSTAGIACSTAQTATTAKLTGLEADSSYSLAAYSDSGCSTELDAVDFSTHLTVGNMGETPAPPILSCTISGDQACAMSFTTGGGSGGGTTSALGFALASVTAKFTTTSDPNGNLGDIVVTLHAAATGAAYGDKLVPASATLATLSGDNPYVAPHSGESLVAKDYTYTCSAGCDLDPNTTYFVKFGATAGTVNPDYYSWVSTFSQDENLVPGAAGWTLANGTDYQSQGQWAGEYWEVGMIRVSATTNTD